MLTWGDGGMEGIPPSLPTSMEASFVSQGATLTARTRQVQKLPIKRSNDRGIAVDSQENTILKQNLLRYTMSRHICYIRPGWHT